IARRIVRLHTVLTEDVADLDVQAAADCGEVSLGVELNRIDTVAIGLAVVGGKLAVEQAARERKAVIAARQDRVTAEAEGRLAGPARNHRTFNAQPVLLEQKFASSVIEAHRQLIARCRTRGEGHIGPAGDLDSTRIEGPAWKGPLQGLHQ